MGEFSVSDFRPDRGGIAEVWTSGGMQSALAGVASAKEAEANAIGHLHGPHGRLYEGGVDVLGMTAVGYVSTAGHLGGVDQAYHHTLDSINH